MAFTDLDTIADMFAALAVPEARGLETYANRLRDIDVEQKRDVRKAKSSHRARCEELTRNGTALSEAAQATVARVRDAHEQELAKSRERLARFRASPQGKIATAESRAYRTEWMRRKRAAQKAQKATP